MAGRSIVSLVANGAAVMLVVGGMIVAASLQPALAQQAGAARSEGAAQATPNAQAVAHYTRGVTQAAAGDTAGAIRSFDAALQISPGYLDALYHRAQSHSDNGDIAAALRDVEAAVAATSGRDRVRALTNRGQVRQNARNHEGAVRDCSEAGVLAEQVGERDGRLRATTSVCLGLAYSSLGELQRAKESYDQAIQWDATDSLAYTGRGHVAFQRGRYQEAVADFEAALRIAPGSQDTLRFLGLAHADRGAVSTALEVYGRAERAVPTDPWPLMLRALALARSGDRQRALADANAAFGIAGASGRSNAFLVRGSVHYALDDLPQASADLEAAVAADGNNGQAHGALGRLRIKQGRLDEAERALEMAQRSLPHDPWLGLNRGLLALARQDHDRAVAEISASLAVNEANAEGFAARGQAYEALGRRDRALADYRTASERLALDNDGRRAQALARERLAALTRTAPVTAAVPPGTPTTETRAPIPVETGAPVTDRTAVAAAPRPTPAAAAERDGQKGEVYDTLVCRAFEGVLSHTRRYTGVDVEVGCRVYAAKAQRP